MDLKDNIKLKKYIKILAIFIFFLFLFIFIINFFVIGFSKSGKVVDAVTGEPLQDIYLNRETQIRLPRFENPAATMIHLIRTDITKTNKNGEFFFPPFLEIKSPFPFFNFQLEELLIVNCYPCYDENHKNLKLTYNSNYVSEEIGPGYHGFFMNEKYYPIYGQPGQSFGLITNVRLIPRVEDISKCQENKDCIYRNKLLQKWDSCKHMPNCMLDFDPAQ